MLPVLEGPREGAAKLTRSSASRASASPKRCDALGLDPSLPVRLAELRPAAEDWSACVRLDLPAGPLYLQLGTRSAGTEAWLRGRYLALAYRPLADGRDPTVAAETSAMLSAVRLRFASLDADGPDGADLSPLRTALARHREFSQMDDRVYRYLAPREAILRLGFRCNQRCGFCWQGRDWPEPPPEMYSTWLDEMAAAGVREIHFSGGEPTIHGELLPLVRRASREHGMAVWIQTNAIRLAQPRYLEEAREAGLSGVFVSYHSADAEVSDRMTAAPGTHRRTEAGIAACLAAGVTVILNCLVERRNHTGLAAHARRIVDVFVRPFPANPVAQVCYTHPGHYFDEAEWREALVPFDEVRPHLIAACRHLAVHGVAVETGGSCGFPACALGEATEFAGLEEPGALGDLNLPDRVYAAACETCAARPWCVGLRAPYLERFGERGLAPFAALTPIRTQGRRCSMLPEA